MRDVIPVNIHWLEESRRFIADFIRANHGPLPTNPNGVMTYTVVHLGRSLNTDAVIEKLQLQEFDLPEHSYSLQDWYPSIWRKRDDADHVFAPVASVLSVNERHVQIMPSGKERIILQFPTLSPDFETGRMSDGPKWVNTVYIRQHGSGPDVASALPSAGFETRKNYPVLGFGGQFVSREGFVAFQQYAHDNDYLELPSPANAIKSWLAADEIEALPSDAGRVAEHIIASVGGLNGTHAFRDKEIIALLDKMARSRKEWVDGSSEEYEDRTATVHQWLRVLKPLKDKGWGAWRTLDTLVEKGLLQLGLSVRCVHCSQKNWYSLDDVGFQLRCSRCVKEFAFPQGQSNQASWAYRPVGPFATPHYARGGYSVALTLRFLNDGIALGTDFTYATGMELRKDGQSVEVDFFAWQSTDVFRRAPKNPATLIGECKSLGIDTFKAADVDNLKKLATLVPGAYLVAATMKDELSAGEVKRLRSLARWAWLQPNPCFLIVLTGLELFADGPFLRDWEDAGGRAAEVMQRHRGIHDLTALAAATQEVHLKMDSDLISDLRYRRRRRSVARISA